MCIQQGSRHTLSINNVSYGPTPLRERTGRESMTGVWSLRPTLSGLFVCLFLMVQYCQPKRGERSVKIVLHVLEVWKGDQVKRFYFVRLVFTEQRPGRTVLLCQNSREERQEHSSTLPSLLRSNGSTLSGLQRERPGQTVLLCQARIE